MSNYFQIPVTNNPNQTFNVSIPQGKNNINLQFFISWNAMALYWQASILNLDTNIQLIVNLPMLPIGPNGNWLGQYVYWGIGSAYIIAVSANAPDHPGINDWAVNGQSGNFILVWSD